MLWFTFFLAFMFMNSWWSLHIILRRLFGIPELRCNQLLWAIDCFNILCCLEFLFREKFPYFRTAPDGWKVSYCQTPSFWKASWVILVLEGVSFDNGEILMNIGSKLQLDLNKFVIAIWPLDLLFCSFCFNMQMVVHFFSQYEQNSCINRLAANVSCTC